MKLSILMPVYNEAEWVEKIIERVVKKRVAGIDQYELVIVDDKSIDRSREIIEGMVKKYPDTIKFYAHEVNSGKGAALKTAIHNMTGDVCIIQDADLEYNPDDYDIILEPIVDGRADCVYGSRFTGSQSKRVLFFWHMIGNKFLTLLSNMCTNLNLTDMETCYKAFRSEILKSIEFESNCFGFEVEVTAAIARKKCRIYEVGISYDGRTYDQGKKITWKDGFKAIYKILKYNLFK